MNDPGCFHFTENYDEAALEWEHKIKNLNDEHRGDIQIKEGLWENTCTGEFYISLEEKNLTQFSWQDYTNFNSLKYMYLNDNNLTEIDGEMFTAFPNLRWLNLRDNQLTSFPKEIQYHPHLETLLLDNNEIVELPIELGSVPKLKGLSICNNPIKYPSKHVVDLPESRLLDYFRNCWNKQTSDVPQLEIIPKEKKKLPKILPSLKFEPIEDIGTFVSRKMKSRDVMDQILADNIMKKIEKQNYILQKRKDLETLKEWRERYLANKSLPIIKPLEAPPYAVYDQYLRTPNRKDLKEDLNTKIKGRTLVTNSRKKRRDHIIEEMRKLEDKLYNVQSTRTSSVMNEQSANKAIVARIEELKALREIQRKVHELRFKQ